MRLMIFALFKLFFFSLQILFRNEVYLNSHFLLVAEKIVSDTSKVV